MENDENDIDEFNFDSIDFRGGLIDHIHQMALSNAQDLKDLDDKFNQLDDKFNSLQRQIHIMIRVANAILPS